MKRDSVRSRDSLKRLHIGGRVQRISVARVLPDLQLAVDFQHRQLIGPGNGHHLDGVLELQFREHPLDQVRHGGLRRAHHFDVVHGTRCSMPNGFSFF